MKITKNLTYALLSVITVIGVFVACSDAPDFEKNNQVQEGDSYMVKVAKELVLSSGSISLPVNGGAKINGMASRSRAAYDTDATPLWDKAKEIKENGNTVLIVPLDGEKLRSHAAYSDGDVKKHQYATASSFLIAVTDGTRSCAYVKTCLPESSYAIDNEIDLPAVIANPKDEGFTGIILNSSLSGEIAYGRRYEAGVQESYIKNRETECDGHHHDENCTHDHESECDHEIRIISIYLYSTSQVQSRSTYTDGEEQQTETCIFCLTKLDEDGLCPVCDKKEEEYCDKCSMPKDDCVCDLYEDICEKCGKLIDNCTCESDANVCGVCGKEPCVCPTTPTPTPDPTPVDTCSNCGKYPCICCDDCGEVNCVCVTNTTPILYVSHTNDMMLSPDFECVGSSTCCAMAVLEMAYTISGGSDMTQEDFYQYYTELTGMSPDEGTVLDRSSTFMTRFFSTSTTTNVTNTVRGGSPVIIRSGMHYVIAVGVQYDGDLIYADPDNNCIYAVNESYFSGCSNIVISNASGTKSVKIVETE